MGAWELELVRPGTAAALTDAIEIHRATVELGRRWDLVPSIGVATRLDDDSGRAVKHARSLADEANAIVLDETSYERVAESVVAERRDERPGLRLLERLPEQAPRDRRVVMPTLEASLALLGTVAGLAAWVAVVGGLTMWARLTAAAVPAGEAVSLLPRDLLVTEGLRTLAVPLLAGLAAATVAAAVENTRAKEWAGAAWTWVSRKGPRWLVEPLRYGSLQERLGAFAVVVGIPGIVLLTGLTWSTGLLFGLEFWWAALLVAVSVASLALMLWLVGRRWDAGALRATLAVFVLAAIWGGAAAILYERGADDPRLETVRVDFGAGRVPEWGLFVARTGDAVLVAQSGAAEPRCGLRIIPETDVTGIVIGAAAATEASTEKQCLPPDEAQDEEAPDSPGPAPTTVRETVVERPPPVTFVETETVATVLTTTVERPPTTTDADPPAPPGAQPFGDGKVSIPVTSVVLPSRLQIAKVRFWPRPLRDPEQPVTMTAWIEDTEGRRVRKAEVVVLATRYGRFRSNVATTESCFDGRAYVTLEPNVSFTPGPRGRVVLLVRAHKAGEPLLAGVSARRLVYFRVAPPTDGRDPAAPFLGCAK